MNSPSLSNKNLKKSYDNGEEGITLFNQAKQKVIYAQLHELAHTKQLRGFCKDEY